MPYLEAIIDLSSHIIASSSSIYPQHRNNSSRVKGLLLRLMISLRQRLPISNRINHAGIGLLRVVDGFGGYQWCKISRKSIIELCFFKSFWCTGTYANTLTFNAIFFHKRCDLPWGNRFSIIISRPWLFLINAHSDDIIYCDNVLAGQIVNNYQQFDVIDFFSFRHTSLQYLPWLLFSVGRAVHTQVVLGETSRLSSGANQV